MKHTNQELVSSLKRLLVETKVVVPYGMAHIAAEIDNLLTDIAEGRKIVVDAEETRIPDGQDEGDPPSQH